MVIYINGEELIGDDYWLCKGFLELIKKFEKSSYLGTRVLIFPNWVTKQARFYFHNCIENYSPNFNTLSIGDNEAKRQLVVYHDSFVENLKKSIEKRKKESIKTEPKPEVTPEKQENVKKTKSRKPDMVFYVPPKGKASASPKQPAEVKSEHNESWDEIYSEEGDSLKPTCSQSIDERLGSLNLDTNIKKAIINELSNRYSMSDITEIEIENADISHLKMYSRDPSGRDAFLRQFVGDPMSHIVEACGFETNITTKDLTAVLSVYNSRGFEIKWVDDLHALILFNSVQSAHEALKYTYPNNIRLRPLVQATPQSIAKVKELPSKVPATGRPKTTAAIARRLVSGALGIKNPASPEQRAEEDRQLKEAREEKRAQQKLAREVWESNQ